MSPATAAVVAQAAAAADAVAEKLASEARAAAKARLTNRPPPPPPPSEGGETPLRVPGTPVIRLLPPREPSPAPTLSFVAPPASTPGASVPPSPTPSNRSEPPPTGQAPTPMLLARPMNRQRSNSQLLKPSAATPAAAKSSKAPPPPPPPPIAAVLPPPAIGVPPPPPPLDDLPAGASLAEREKHVAAREARVAQRERELEAWQARLEARARALEAPPPSPARTAALEAPPVTIRTVGRSNTLTRAAAAAVTVATATAGGDVPPPLPPQVDLPEGWGESQDSQGRPIYFDVFTRHEQTEKPTEPSAGWLRHVFSRQRAALRRMKTTKDLSADPEAMKQLSELCARMPLAVVDAPPVDASAGNREQHIRLTRELYETERSFNDGLKLATVYRYELLKRVAAGQLGDVKRDDIYVVFPDALDDVAVFSSDLLRSLAPSGTSNVPVGPDERPGAVMSRAAPGLAKFAAYLVAYQASSNMLKEIAKRPSVEKALADIRAQNASSAGGGSAKLTLSDLLIMPVQRCPRYELLLGALIASAVDDGDRKQLAEARELVRAANEFNDDRLSEAHNEAAILAIQSEIHQCPPLVMIDRRFLLRSTLTRSKPPHRSKDRETHTFILFSDVLLEVETLPKPIGAAKLRLVATLEISNLTVWRPVPADVLPDVDVSRAFYLRYGPRAQLEDAFIASNETTAQAWRTAVLSLNGD
jgi:hypothetical protein